MSEYRVAATGYAPNRPDGVYTMIDATTELQRRLLDLLE